MPVCTILPTTNPHFFRSLPEVEDHVTSSRWLPWYSHVSVTRSPSNAITRSVFGKIFSLPVIILRKKKITPKHIFIFFTINNCLQLIPEYLIIQLIQPHKLHYGKTLIHLFQTRMPIDMSKFNSAFQSFQT